MGTNYFLPPECGSPCYHCADTGLHIGKRSAGWTFGFQSHPSEGLTSWTAWQERIAAEGLVIDEYGDRFTPAEFTAMVQRTREPWGPRWIIPCGRSGHPGFLGDDRHSIDADGWDFWEGGFS